MTAREKNLALGIGGMAALILLLAGGRVWFVKPLHALDDQIAAAKEKLGKIQDERRAYFAAEDRLKQTARTTYAETVSQAAAVSGEWLTRQIITAGLSETNFSRLPVGPRKLRGAAEIGWNIQGEGALTNIINLLYLLDRGPWLHRLENLACSAGDAPGRARVHAAYLTLVMDPPLEVPHTNAAGPVALNAPGRRELDDLVVRDLLRPYLPPPPAPPAAPAARVAAAPKPAAAPGPENYRIVSLSEWEGRPEIHVRDLAAQKTKRYLVGDELAGGRAVTVDYRPRPDPAHPARLSSSRVLLLINRQYWAVEAGQTLADKHLLTPAELPPGLQP